jgi:hypothetical protein
MHEKQKDWVSRQHGISTQHERPYSVPVQSREGIHAGMYAALMWLAGLRQLVPWCITSTRDASQGPSDSTSSSMAALGFAVRLLVLPRRS